MKPKIFFIVSSLGAGGSERVYWLLAQYFNSKAYQVSVVFLNVNDRCFSNKLQGIKFIDLKTVKASRSFFKLYRLLKHEKPFAVFSTTDHINVLTGMVACLLEIPRLIARTSNDPQAMKQFYGLKAQFYNFFSRPIFRCFDTIVCQTEEMANAVAKLYGTNKDKMIVIANPACKLELTKLKRNSHHYLNLVTVARLAKEKGLFRLLELMTILPSNYRLTIIGSGTLKESLEEYVLDNDLANRVIFKGHSSNVPRELLEHDLMVMTSYTEGFPNALLESLSIGLPVITFEVSGAKELIREGFNGYIVPQGNLQKLREKIIEAGQKQWIYAQIKADARERFSLEKIGQAYEKLLTI